MATLGLLFIGLLFGLFLSLVVAAFLLLNLDPRLRDDLLARRRSVLDLVRPRQVPGRSPTGPSHHPGLDQKIRSLQEEVRISQKLLEGSREAAETKRREAESLAAEVAGLRQQVAAGDTARQALATELESRQEACRTLEAQLAAAREQMARREREARDLAIELDLARAGERLLQG